MASDIEDRLAELLWHFRYQGLWCRKGAYPMEAMIDAHPVPSLTDDRFLGWAVARLREAGYDWATAPGAPWLAFDEQMNVVGRVKRTGDDALDFANLLAAVLEAKAKNGGANG